MSITDVGSEPVRFADNSFIKGICRVSFDDVDFGQPNCITPKDAQEIVDFILRLGNSVELVIVHCEAGISRSAGVCAALMKIFTDSDAAIFDNPAYRPNMSCYRSVMNSQKGDTKNAGIHST